MVEWLSQNRHISKHNIQLPIVSFQNRKKYSPSIFVWRKFSKNFYSNNKKRINRRPALSSSTIWSWMRLSFTLLLGILLTTYISLEMRYICVFFFIFVSPPTWKKSNITKMKSVWLWKGARFESVDAFDSVA